MRCRQCDYALWDLPSRKCPECGTPFKPSEYEFQPGAIQYLCPHCRQCYYGTDAKGHLWPRSFTCVKCNQPIDMDEMLLVPAEGWEEDETSGKKLPWLERRKIGFFKGLFKTIWMALTSPSLVMKRLPANQQQTSGRLLFAVLTNLLIASIALIPHVLIQQLLTFGGMPGGGMSNKISVMCGMGIGLFLFGTVGVIIGLVVWALTTHVVLRITGRIRGSFSDTFSAFCYSVGANAASAIPCIGTYVGWIWWMISATLMVRERQKVHGFRASLAVCVAPLLLIAAMVAAPFYFISQLPQPQHYITTTGPSGMPGYVPYAQGPVAAGNSAEMQTYNMWRALREYADKHNGAFPSHALQLSVANHIAPYDFVGNGSPTMLDYVLLTDDMNLIDFMALNASEQAKTAQKVIDNMPKDVVAHRIGDYVFTYHGVDKISNNADLWVIVRHVPATPNRSFATYAATADGTIHVFSSNELTQRLAQQNALRTSRGLPPLPPPDTLTHDSPFAVANGGQSNAAP